MHKQSQWDWGPRKLGTGSCRAGGEQWKLEGRSTPATGRFGATLRCTAGLQRGVAALLELTLPKVHLLVKECLLHADLLQSGQHIRTSIITLKEIVVLCRIRLQVEHQWGLMAHQGGCSVAVLVRGCAAVEGAWRDTRWRSR